MMHLQAMATGSRRKTTITRNPPTSVEYVVVGGGGGGAGDFSGGGGAGEVRTGTLSIQPLANYYFQVGGGGSPYSDGYDSYIYVYAVSGQNNAAYEIISFGGGRGTQFGYYGNNGHLSIYSTHGSGGGGAAYNWNSASLGQHPGYQHGSSPTSPPTHSNPYASWGRIGDATTQYGVGGGGGGASLATTTTSVTDKDGVDGIDVSAVNGTSLFLGGGGGGSGYYLYGAQGGNGGGGQGNPNQYSTYGATDGVANTGGGGGGGNEYGGSGRIIIAYPSTYDDLFNIYGSSGNWSMSTTQRANYKVYTFTGSTALKIG